ncbi:MAG: protein kinase domain-containing protein, partial [Planctomycetota bacterium]
MNREKWQRVRSVFDDVVESDADERARVLASEAPEIRKEVEALLESHDAIVDQRIEPGTVIDKYEIVRMLGDGGMGSVYLARQRSPIQRDVALKVIRDGWVTADLLQRFQAERQVLATLNHPNISAVLDAGATQSRRHYFVMEYVDGVPITDYCRDRRLGRRERLELMDRVFDAIQHAHAKGIVHRDLKPTNVLVAEQGGKAVPKVIDFGIAKSIDAEATPYTVTGQLLGTPAYMSPEQARGRTVDSRTDLWALGCLLYEIETGQPTFPCENLGDTIVAILSTEPDMSLLPADTPAALRRLLRRCLAKDPELRQASAADARLDLVESREGALDAERPERRGRWTAIAWVAAILLAIAGFWSRGNPETASRPPRKLQIVAAGVARHERAAPVLAPDGRAFAYVRDGKLWVRRLDSLDAFMIAGTEGAAYPFWSPDSRSLGYFAAGSICRVPVGGGEITKVFQLRGDIVGGAGAVWTRDDEIYYGRGNTALYVIPARGGERRTAYDPPKAHVHGPAALPNGGVFFVVHGAHTPNRIAALVDGDCNLVLDVGDQRIGGIAWSSTGHMVMARGPVDAGIWAVPYSVEAGTIGKSFRVAPDGGRPSVADDGSLLYVPATYAERMQLGWV